MRIAADGKPFDVDHVAEEKREDEVEVIQFLRPHGRRKRLLASVGEDLAKLAENMVISAEELQDGKVATYVRMKDEPEEKESMELADNGPGENSPTECLKKLIRKKANEQLENSLEFAQELHQEDAKDKD